MDDPVVVEIRLPAPVDQVAAVTQLLGKAWPTAKIGSGPHCQILIPRRPKPKRVTQVAMADILKELATEDDPDVELVGFRDGHLSFSVDSKDEAWQRLASWAYIALSFFEAPNYVEQEVDVTDPEGTTRRMLLTACWSKEQTPHALRAKAERELAECRAELERVRAELETCKEAL